MTSSRTPMPSTGPRSDVQTPTTTGSPRLRMDPSRAHHGVLDGAWWPWTNDLAAELPGLIAGLDAWLDTPTPGHGQHVSRVAVNVLGWTAVPTRVEVAGRRVHVAWFTSIDAHTISASCPNIDHLDLLVVPPGTAYGPAKTAMARAADGRGTLRGTEILAELSSVPARPTDG